MRPRFLVMIMMTTTAGEARRRRTKAAGAAGGRAGVAGLVRYCARCRVRSRPAASSMGMGMDQLAHETRVHGRADDSVLLDHRPGRSDPFHAMTSEATARWAAPMIYFYICFQYCLIFVMPVRPTCRSWGLALEEDKLAHLGMPSHCFITGRDVFDTRAWRERKVARAPSSIAH